MIGFIAIHYPQPAHRANFIARVQSAADAMSPTPGCLSATCSVHLRRDIVGQDVGDPDQTTAGLVHDDHPEAGVVIDE